MSNYCFSQSLAWFQPRTWWMNIEWSWKNANMKDNWTCSLTQNKSSTDDQVSGSEAEPLTLLAVFIMLFSILSVGSKRRAVELLPCSRLFLGAGNELLERDGDRILAGGIKGTFWSGFLLEVSLKFVIFVRFYVNNPRHYSLLLSYTNILSYTLSSDSLRFTFFNSLFL